MWRRFLLAPLVALASIVYIAIHRYDLSSVHRLIESKYTSNVRGLIESLSVQPLSKETTKYWVHLAWTQPPHPFDVLIYERTLRRMPLHSIIAAARQHPSLNHFETLCNATIGDIELRSDHVAHYCEIVEAHHQQILLTPSCELLSRTIRSLQALSKGLHLIQEADDPGLSDSPAELVRLIEDYQDRGAKRNKLRMLSRHSNRLIMDWAMSTVMRELNTNVKTARLFGVEIVRKITATDVIREVLEVTDDLTSTVEPLSHQGMQGDTTKASSEEHVGSR